MSEEIPQKEMSLKVRPWDEDTVFTVLSDPMRRRILGLLSRHKPMTAMELNALTGGTRPALIKHLTCMCTLGVVLQKENPKDRRQPLYALSSSVVICETDEFLSVDLGFCMKRFKVTR